MNQLLHIEESGIITARFAYSVDPQASFKLEKGIYSCYKNYDKNYLIINYANGFIVHVDYCDLISVPSYIWHISTCD